MAAVTGGGELANTDLIATRSSAPESKWNVIGGLPACPLLRCLVRSHAASSAIPSKMKSTSREMDNHSAMDQALASPKSCATSLKKTLT